MVDIAKKLKISVSSVSRDLNEHPDIKEYDGNYFFFKILLNFFVFF